MAVTTIRELLDAGAHFGANASLWNPRMKPYIHGKRNRIHIIDLTHTVRGLVRATKFLEEVAATGRQIVYVCTKRHMRDVVLAAADKARMPRVTERWLGGTLTNFKTVRSRLAALEAMEEQLETEELTKKARASLMRKARRIRKNLDGLRDLNRIPGAMLVVDPKREHIAVAEAQRVGVPVVALLDTDCDPSMVDIPVPANDDSLRAVELLLGKLTASIAAGVARFESSGRAPEDAVGAVQGGEFTAFEQKPDESGEDQGGEAESLADAETSDAAEAEAPSEAETEPEPAKTESAPTESTETEPTKS